MAYATADFAAAEDDGDGDDTDDSDEYFAGWMTSSEISPCKLENV